MWMITYKKVHLFQRFSVCQLHFMDSYESIKNENLLNIMCDDIIRLAESLKTTMDQQVQMYNELLEENRTLKAKIADLEQFADHSIVKNFAKQIQDLKDENSMYKARFVKNTEQLSSNRTSTLPKNQQTMPEPLSLSLSIPEQQVSNRMPISSVRTTDMPISAPIPSVRTAEVPAPVPSVRTTEVPVPSVRTTEVPAPIPSVRTTEVPAPVPSVRTAEVPVPIPSVRTAEVPAPVQVQVPSVRTAEVQPEVVLQDSGDENDENSDSDTSQLIQLSLERGTYWYDIDTRELFEIVDDKNIGDKVGQMYEVEVDGTKYLTDSCHNMIYATNDNNEINELVGCVVDIDGNKYSFMKQTKQLVPHNPSLSSVKVSVKIINKVHYYYESISNGLYSITSEGLIEKLCGKLEGKRARMFT